MRTSKKISIHLFMLGLTVLFLLILALACPMEWEERHWELMFYSVLNLTLVITYISIRIK